MFEIGKREFLQLCKGVKSVLIILLFLVTSYYSAKFAEPLAEVTEMTAKEAAQAHVAGLMFLILIFGQLFVTSLSHDSINREIHERTMRFLVTKTTRLSILLGKFLGIWMFWFVSLFLSYLIISIITKKVSILMFSQTMSLLTFQVAFVLLLSVLIRSPGITMFFGIISSLIFPIIGGWLMLTSNPAISWLKYITPYYYMEKEDYKFLIIFVFAAVLIYLADLVFKRKEC
ncbi:ABC transporter permease [Niallia taxi]|uniref:ABC transporter permease n=1 Tax=Niallia taxi TaxID=2499688 RepID=UPI0011A8DECE|nr:ABC transporter permease subunit [Niallia taxi]MCT2346626.1 ABC transporter permease [Niallia taxi]MED3964001.1 ABC transporter permease subunit [Niallia taxi]